MNNISLVFSVQCTEVFFVFLYLLQRIKFSNSKYSSKTYAF